jgi:ABC-type branched-subunit amino acid transport system permease subunit
VSRKNVVAYKLQALVLGAAQGGLASVFSASQFSFFRPTTSRRC